MVVSQLASLLKKEDCRLHSLCLDDSNLKEHTPIILEALADNTSLEKINIRYIYIEYNIAATDNSLLPFLSLPSPLSPLPSPLSPLPSPLSPLSSGLVVTTWVVVVRGVWRRLSSVTAHWWRCVGTEMTLL